MISEQQWMYADFLAPILFPNSSPNGAGINIGGRSEVAKNETTTNDTNIQDEAIILSNLMGAVISDLSSSNQTNQSGIGISSSVLTEILNRTKRWSEDEATASGDDEGNSSSIDASEVMKNLAYLENDPNAAFKPSSAFFSLLTGGNRGISNSSLFFLLGVFFSSLMVHVTFFLTFLFNHRKAF